MAVSLSHSFRQRLMTGGILFACFSFFVVFYVPLLWFVFLVVAAYIIITDELPRLVSSLAFRSLLAVTYIIIPFALCMYLYSFYRIVLMSAMVLTFSNDTGGYIVGNVCGRHKIAPTISPNKTWEGFCGGIVFTFGIMTLISYVVLGFMPLVSHLILFSFLLGSVATVGDFFESWLKRQAGVKDSGSLLPGHGGLLDRGDSLIFVIVMCYFLKDYIMRIFSQAIGV